MSQLIAIGRFSHITGLSIKALRLYAEEGLLAPAYVDPSSGYRYYTWPQAQVAARIRFFRHLSMPLDVIHAILQAQDAEEIRQQLKQYQTRVSERMARDQRTLFLLQRFLENQEGIMAYPFEIKEVPDQPVVCIRMHTPPAAFAQTIPSAITELLTYAQQQGIFCPDKATLVIHHAYDEEDADVEVCVPVEHVVAGEGRITSRILPGGPAATLMHTGPYEELGLIYPSLAAWIKEHGHEMNGPAYEAFWDGPWNVSDPAQYRTEVMWPIRVATATK